MKTIKFFLLAATFLIISNGVRAEDGVSISGFADMSCGAWSASAGDKFGRTQYLLWFRGFISGYNYGRPQGQVMPDQLPSNDTIALYVDHYCQANPLSGFPGAAFQLVKELRGER